LDTWFQIQPNQNIHLMFISGGKKYKNPLDLLNKKAKVARK